jgi:hypothetical protein
MENVYTPEEKLKCLIEAYRIISEILGTSSDKKEAVGADDTLPVFIYSILKACPSKLVTNLK